MDRVCLTKWLIGFADDAFLSSRVLPLSDFDRRRAANGFGMETVEIDMGTEQLECQWGQPLRES
tara:strand:+ start:291704 stop:291895 length:192 start_codon:yes stop_codon:yes gene_type:complete